MTEKCTAVTAAKPRRAPNKRPSGKIASARPPRRAEHWLEIDLATGAYTFTFADGSGCVLTRQQVGNIPDGDIFAAVIARRT